MEKQKHDFPQMIPRSIAATPARSAVWKCFCASSLKTCRETSENIKNNVSRRAERAGNAATDRENILEKM